MRVEVAPLDVGGFGRTRYLDRPRRGVRGAGGKLGLTVKPGESGRGAAGVATEGAMY